MGVDDKKTLIEMFQVRTKELENKLSFLSEKNLDKMDENDRTNTLREIADITAQIEKNKLSIAKLQSSKFNQYLIQVVSDLLGQKNNKDKWEKFISIKNDFISNENFQVDSKLLDIFKQTNLLLKEQSIELKNIFQDFDWSHFKELLVDQNEWESELFNSDENNPSESINQLALRILVPSKGEDVLDLCSGQGGFLAETYTEVPAANLFGQEISPRNALSSEIRLYKLGSRTHTIKTGDVVKNPAFFDGACFKQFDKVFSNFPFLMRIDNESINAIARYWKIYPIELSTKNTADWLFIGAALNQLKEDGKVVAVMCSGPLFKQSDRDVRAKLIGDRLIEAIIHLPENMLSYTKISTDMIILSNNNEAIKMIDASDIYTEGRRVNEFSQENISKILSLYLENKESNISRFVSREEIRTNDFNLDPTRYLVYNRIKIHSPVKLDEVTEKIFRGIQISADEMDKIIKIDPEIKSPYKILNIGDVNNGEISKELPFAYVETCKRYDRYCLEDGDILLPAKGTKIKTAVASVDDEERIVATGNIIVIRVKRHKINPYYLKAFLDSETGQKLLRSVQTGTAMVSISPSQLEEMEISLLDHERQERVAQQYLVNQDLIKRMRQKLSTLESEMESLYDSIIEE